MQQLLMFQESREDRLEREMMKLREQHDRVRKSQFAKIGELEKMYEETRHDLDLLKLAIRRGQIQI